MTSSTSINENVLTRLRWRYATKRFDPNRKISPADWQTLEESLVLTPSSFGLQPWRFLVITDPALREKLVPVSWGQRQVADASHLVVFAVRKSLGEGDVDRYLNRISEVRGVGADSLKGFRDMLLGFLAQPAERFNAANWAARQAYIALGQFMTTAALLGIDTCPMEGLEPEKYDEILGLGAQGYQTVVACPAGYRAPTDKYATLPKVRFPASEVISHVG